MSNSKPYNPASPPAACRTRHLHLPRCAVALALSLPVLSISAAASAVAPAAPPLMPAPAEIRLAEGRLPVNNAWTVALGSNPDARISGALARVLTRWQERTGIAFARTAKGEFAFADAANAGAATLVIECRAASPTVPVLKADESYELEISGTQATLRAAETFGVLRGLETVAQLLQGDAQGWFLPAVAVNDRPRFPWRGLMIDVCRHWQPLEVVRRNIDAMTVVKLNVLHLHLTEDQGFRIESKLLPQLHELGSDGHYFTQEQIREIIAYAGARGIRVVPEFDMPGHTTSWLVAFPELASGPGPYVVQRRWGIFNPVMDPTNEATYAMLETFFGEMAALFPDDYMHIGGDENNGVQWSANPRIQEFIRERGLKDNAGLQTYFNRRVQEILQKHGKKLIGWDEVLHPELPHDIVVQSWRGAEGLADAARQGYHVILSNGYYIDMCRTAAFHYANDPLPANTPLSPEQQRHILGGEATMWGEWITPETIDSRIWPRTAAIAERLWSPREVNDPASMYQRLAIVSRRLEEAGARHDSHRPAMLRRFAGDSASPALLQSLTTLTDAIEPVKDLARFKRHPDQLAALTELPDIARPESDAARNFSDAVAAMLADARPTAAPAAATVKATLMAWRDAGQHIVQAGADASPRVAQEAVPVAKALTEIALAGLEAIERLEKQTRADAAWRSATEAKVKAAGAPGGDVLLQMAGAVIRLVGAASP